MKKIIYSLILIFSINICNAQLDITEKTDEAIIGTITIMGSKYAEIDYYKELDKYLISFINIKYSIITDYESFWMDENSLNELYSLINKNLLSKEKKEVDIQLKKDKLRLEFKKGRVSFWLYNGAYWSYSYSFNNKQINKLFNK